MKFSRYLFGFYLTISLLGSWLAAQQPPAASSVAATVPRLVNFSGKATDIQGRAISGIAGATFAIYKEESGGSPLWLETQNIQGDAKGNYTAQLGATKPDGLPLDVFTSGEARWLGVTVNGGQEQPRVLLLSVPYALKAADAETIGGLPASAFVLAGKSQGSAPSAKAAPATTSAAKNGAPPANPAVTGKGTLDFIPMWDSTSDIINSTIFQKSSQIGIGTTAPAATLDVNGKSDVRDTLTLFPKGTAPTLAISGTTFKVDQTGKVTFASGQTFPGAGTVTNVALSAPSTDFTVTGSPITKSGTLGLKWNVVPTSADIANAIVKRDVNGSFSAYNVTVNELLPNTIEINSGLFTNGISVTNTCASCLGVFADANNSSGTGIGVWGQSDSAQFGAKGVIGVTSASSGETFGVIGQSNSNVGTGVSGRIGSQFGNVASSILGTVPIGTLGDSTGYGVVATSDTSNALLAENNSTADTLIAVNNGGGAPLYAQGTGGNYMFMDKNGNLFLTGQVFASAKDFKIDHPLNPANKYLYHASVESSEMMNLYTGNITTDSQGVATVRLPEWFETVNTDFRYQLTVIGQFAQAIVSSKIENHEFGIRTSTPSVEVSWQVTGVRHDAYAKAHPLQVSVDKADDERGYYIHPELYGAAAEKGLASARRTQVMQHAKNAQVQPGKEMKP